MVYHVKMTNLNLFSFETFRIQFQVRRDYFTIDFKDPTALRELTCALASYYSNITLAVPINRLIPTLPLRLNYLLWVQDLLAFHQGAQEGQECVTGIDIGIYYRYMGIARVSKYDFPFCHVIPLFCSTLFLG